eukprot:307243-Rhodomonas_salina.1
MPGRLKSKHMIMITAVIQEHIWSLPTRYARLRSGCAALLVPLQYSWPLVVTSSTASHRSNSKHLYSDVPK